jgi:hypothetical protein
LGPAGGLLVQVSRWRAADRFCAERRRIMSLAFYTPTDWNFVTSGGGELDVGVSRILFVGGELGAFYVRRGEGTVYRIPFLAGVGGGGLAASAGGPITLSLSLPMQPGGGWRIYRNRIRRDSLNLEHLSGGCFGVSGVGAVGFSGSLSIVFLGIPILVRVAEGGAGLVGAILGSALGANAAAIYYGTAETSSAGVSASIFTGHAMAASPAFQGETG